MPKPTKMPRITPPTLSRAKVKGRGINITVKVAKLPRARVMWQYTADMGQTCLNDAPLKDGGTEQCVLVLPMPSLKSARQRAKFENLSEEEQWEKIVQITERGDLSPSEQATEILGLFNGKQK